MFQAIKVIVLVAGFFIVANASPVFAADQKIALVDVQVLLTQSKAGQNIQKQLETHKTKFLAEINKQEQELRDQEKKLAEEKATLSKEDFAKKAKSFEEKLNATRQKAQSRKKALEKGATEGVSKLRTELYKIVQALANEKGYSMVINRQNVVVNSDTSLDITDEALKRLDAQISEIALKVSDQ